MDITQKMKFSIKVFLSKCDQICSFLWNWSHLLNKSLMENFIFCAVGGILSVTNQNKQQPQNSSSKQNQW